MISLKTFLYKAKAKIHRGFIIESKGKPFYNLLYISYWHGKLAGKKKRNEVIQYMTARPNPGAGIGHQLANWLSGYKMAQYYSLTYSTYPFSDLSNPLSPNEWDSFLGLNIGEIHTKDLIRRGYKKVLLPKINFDKEKERNLLSDIIRSYKGQHVVFHLEMDQFAGSELKSLEFMREKYWNAPARQADMLKYNPEHFNVAVHVRRGDIVQNDGEKNDNLTMRWLDISYYHNMLKKYLSQYSKGRVVELYIFSQTGKSELTGFDSFGIVHYCNDMDAMASFLHMVNADMLIMSKSGMSYQAAKLNKRGIIIYPDGFWREPLESKQWIHTGNPGT